MADPQPEASVPDVTEARHLFPATADRSYLNTAAVGLASHQLAQTYHAVIDEWATRGLDFAQGEQAANDARVRAARIFGADPADLALIPSMSSAAGLVAAQFGPAGAGANVVIGEREYSSNHFPWRQLEHKGYEVRQVPFRGGGLDPEDVEQRIDGGTQVVAFSGVQSATGHRSDITAISSLARHVGAIVFVDGSQMVGALPVAPDLQHVDVLATADHKFLLNAGRGMGYCFLSRAMQERLIPINAGWRAGADPFAELLRPRHEAVVDSITLRQLHQLAGCLRQRRFARDLRPVRSRTSSMPATATSRHVCATPSTARAGARIAMPAENRSTIVRVPLGDLEPAWVVQLLAEERVIASARDGALRLSVHLYNHEDDIDRLVTALGSLGRPAPATRP